MAEPNVTYVITGSGVGYIAAYGATLPSLATKPAAADWATALFAAMGYTDSGYEFAYTPNVKGITVDEVGGPVKHVLDSEEATIKVTLAEASVENLNRSFGPSTLTNPGLGIKTLTGGGGTLKDWVVAIQEPSVGGADARVIILFKANVTSAVNITAKRTDKQMIQVTFSGLIDSTLAAGAQLYKVVEFGAGS